jgi:heterodisulfide reductase subunit A-like polyferredoxin
MRAWEVEKELLLEEKIHQFCKSLGDGHFGDVMVVGGGISGIQASLDLATAGFKVYLVEKSPAIGGHMAQLDKTFPTNDCSM